MQNSYERRRYKRLPIEMTLDINKVYKQDNNIIDSLDAEISVFDISKTGIGFISEATLPLDYYFDGTIYLSENDFIRAVIKIVRATKLDDGSFNYGAEFVGLAQFLASKIDKYEKTLNGEHDRGFLI